MSACRSCGAPVHWAWTTAGRVIPVDREPCASGGNIQLVDAGGRLVAIVGVAGSGTHRSHFASCRNADAHRKERRR